MLSKIIFSIAIISGIYGSENKNIASSTKVNQPNQPNRPNQPSRPVQFANLKNFCKLWKRDQAIPLAGDNENDKELLNQILQKIFDSKNKIVTEWVSLTLVKSECKIQIVYNRDLDSIRFVVIGNKMQLPSILYIIQLLQATKPRLKNIYILLPTQLGISEVDTIKSSLFAGESRIGSVHGYHVASGFDQYLARMLTTLGLETRDYSNTLKSLVKNSPYLCYIGGIKDLSENIHVIYPGNLASIAHISDKYISNIDFQLNFANPTDFFQYIIQQSFGLGKGVEPNEFHEGSNVWVRINNQPLSIENLMQLIGKMRYGTLSYMNNDVNQMNTSVFTKLRPTQNGSGYISLSSSGILDNATKKPLIDIKFVYPKQQNNNEHVTIKCHTTNTLENVLIFLNTGNYFDLPDAQRLKFIQNYNKPELTINELKEWLTLERGSTLYESEGGVSLPLRRKLRVEYNYNKDNLGEVIEDIAKQINDVFTSVKCTAVKSGQELNISIVGDTKGVTHGIFSLTSQTCKRKCLAAIRNFIPEGDVPKLLGSEFTGLEGFCQDKTEFILGGWSSNSEALTLIGTKGTKYTVPLNIPYYTPVEIVETILAKQPGKRFIFQIGTDAQIIKADQSHFSPEWSSIFVEQKDFNYMSDYDINKMLSRYQTILPVPSNDLYLQGKYKDLFTHLNGLAVELMKIIKDGATFAFQFNTMIIKLPNNSGEIVICAKDDAYFEWIYFIKSLAQQINNNKSVNIKLEPEYNNWLTKLVKLANNADCKSILTKMQDVAYNTWWDRQYCRLQSTITQDSTKFWYKEDGNICTLAEGDNPGTGYLPFNQEQALLMASITGTNRFAREVIEYIL